MKKRETFIKRDTNLKRKEHLHNYDILLNKNKETKIPKSLETRNNEKFQKIKN